MENLVRLSPFVKFKEPDYVFVPNSWHPMYPMTFVVQGTNMMFTAGLMMAIAVEHCGLHHRYHPPGKLKETNASSQTKVISLRPGL
jgi:hypothetical protein